MQTTARHLYQQRLPNSSTMHHTPRSSSMPKNYTHSSTQSDPYVDKQESPTRQYYGRVELSPPNLPNNVAFDVQETKAAWNMIPGMEAVFNNPVLDEAIDLARRQYISSVHNTAPCADMKFVISLQCFVRHPSCEQNNQIRNTPLQLSHRIDWNSTHELRHSLDTKPFVGPTTETSDQLRHSAACSDGAGDKFREAETLPLDGSCLTARSNAAIVKDQPAMPSSVDGQPQTTSTPTVAQHQASPQLQVSQESHIDEAQAVVDAQKHHHLIKPNF